MIVEIKLPAPIRRLTLATEDNPDGRLQCKHLPATFADEFHMVSHQGGSQPSPLEIFTT
jgi:hypothetical protein